MGTDTSETLKVWAFSENVSLGLWVITKHYIITISCYTFQKCLKVLLQSILKSVAYPCSIFNFILIFSCHTKKEKDKIRQEAKVQQNQSISQNIAIPIITLQTEGQSLCFPWRRLVTQ